jgi:hypothetical protein
MIRQRTQQELNHIKSSWFVDDAGVLRWKRVANGGVCIGDAVGASIAKTGHKSVVLYFDGKQRGHQYGAVCWFLCHGNWPEFEVDHIDRNPANNCKNNLRLATKSQNRVNRVMPNKCGHQGVYMRQSGRYSAQTWQNGEAINLGTFDTVEAAANARAESQKLLHGKFAVTQ